MLYNKILFCLNCCCLALVFLQIAVHNQAFHEKPNLYLHITHTLHAICQYRCKNPEIHTGLFPVTVTSITIEGKLIQPTLVNDSFGDVKQGELMLRVKFSYMPQSGVVFTFICCCFCFQSPLFHMPQPLESTGQHQTLP